MGKPRILVVDDHEDIRNILSDRLKMYGYEVLTASDGQEALEKVDEATPELVLLDIRLPILDGMEVLDRIKLEHPETLVIMITAFGTVQLAVEAMRKGAYDFIEKPFDPPDIIKIKVEKALERQALVRENEYLRSELKGEYGELIGKSQKTIEVLRMIEKVAPSDSTVLITGESGTGKELVARAIYGNSPRSSGSFVVVNCSAIQPTLLESEIFGHEKGAFTGAIARKPGKMELADGGILFLDEIGDMANELQAKLLRAIQEKEFERVGGTAPIKVDVRFIAATNRDLQKAIQEGNFREDLFYRLNVVNIDLPPLRENREDIPLLVEHFLQKQSAALKRRGIQITDRAMEILLNYRWPGNVRELQNCIERAILLADSDLIGTEYLPQEVRAGVTPETVQTEAPVKPGVPLKDMEKAHILKTLEEVGGKRTEAAKRLGISLRKLQYKLKEYMDEGD
jgi:two-component system NtrC family response regulator